MQRCFPAPARPVSPTEAGGFYYGSSHAHSDAADRNAGHDDGHRQTSPAPTMPAGFDIYPITVQSAVEWAKGLIHDSQLDRSRIEIVFWNELDDLGSYRKALAAVKGLQDQGCRAMIVHACNPAVWHKLDREGSTCTMQEQIVWRGQSVAARRYIVPPVVFKRWLGKIFQNISASSGLISSR